MSCMCQDALTDLTGDSERLPVEEQQGTWLGHKVSEHHFKPFVYNTHSALHFAVSLEISPLMFICSS